MKKIISLLATVAMISSLFVSVVKADFAPVIVTTPVQLSNADFHDAFDMDIPEGENAYLVTVDFTNLGDLNCSVSKIGTKHTGRKLQGFGYNIAFDNIANVDTDLTMSIENAMGANLSEGYVGSTLTSIFNAGSAADAYPNTDKATISNATGIPGAITYLVLTSASATVTATVSANVNVVNYSNNYYGAEEQTNSATMSPALLTFAPAAPTTYTYTFKNADGTADIEVQSGLAAGATVTAPTAPTVAGKTFDHWSESIGGAEVAVDATASADKTYYAVYVDAAPSYDKINPDTTEQAAKVVDGTEKTYTDYSGNDVPLTKGYAIARFQTSITPAAKSYVLHVDTTSEGSKDFDMSFGGIEVSGTANFVVILKNAPAGAAMEIRATDK